MVPQNTLSTWEWRKFFLTLLSMYTNALNKSNCLFRCTCVHRILSYHQMYNYQDFTNFCGVCPGFTWFIRQDPILTGDPNPSHVVLVSDGKSEHVAQRRIGFFGEKKIRYVTALNLSKCPDPKLKCHRLFSTCAPNSELPSHISTMIPTFY